MTAVSDSTVRGRRTLIATAGIVLGSAPGMLLPFVITAWFTAGTDTDVYFLTVGAATFAATVLTIVMERTVIPYAAVAAQRGGAQLSALTRRLASQSAALGGLSHVIASTVLIALVMPSTTFSDDARSLATRLAVVLVAFPVLAAANSVVAGALFGVHRFAVGTYSLSLRSLGALTVGLLWRDSWGLEAIALGLVVGEALRTGVLVWHLRSVVREHATGDTDEKPGAGFWRQALPHTASMVIVSLNPMVDRSIAATLQPGSTTALELADKLYYAPSVLVGSGLAIVSGAHWAAMVGSPGTAKGLRRDYYRSQRLTMAAAVLVAAFAALVVWLGMDLVRPVFGVPPALPLASTFMLLVIGLPFALSAELAVRVLVIFKRTWIFPVSAVLLLCLNIGADLVGAALFGLEGIAAASTLVRVASAAILGIAAHGALAAHMRTRP